MSIVRVIPAASLRRATALALLAAVCCLLHAARATAQDKPRLLDQDPYDQITLDEANDSSVIKVAPIRFPGGKPPEKPKSSDKLTVTLLDTGNEYQVAWRHIIKLEQFEDLLLSEFKRLSAAGKFDEAFEYLLHLRSNYAQVKGLDAAHNAYLYQSAGGAFRQGKFAEALGLLEELHRREPRFQLSADGPTLVQVLGSAGDRLIGEYVDKEDYRSARTLLERLTKKYLAADEPFAVRWRQELSETAAEHRDAARESLAAGEYVAAYDAFARMREIWPQVEGGPQLATEMAERYPLVKVGVLAPALAHDARSLADPSARRTGRLVERRLFEYQGMGPEGGRYLCPFGDTELSDDHRQLTFRLRPAETASGGPSGEHNAREPLNGYRLSQYLLPTVARPESAGESALRQLIESVEVSNVWQVDVNFRRSHVLPQAALQDALSIAGDPPGATGPFRPLDPTEKVTRYVARREGSELPPGRLAEIVERTYDDPQRALLALQRGEIDVLERVFPADVPELRRSGELTVDTFGVPTTHFIVIRPHSPYLASRTFRRALVYGSDRETILRETLLRGASLPGYRVVSGVFPAPSSSSDAVAYGYDQHIAPRPYNPRLALTLRLLGQQEVKAMFDKREQKLPPLGRLTLAHPADEVARIACRALAVQWKAIGVEVELVELPPGVFIDEGQKHDLLYVAAQTAEPLVDAARLFGRDGLTPTENNFIQLCLRKIATSSNWQQVRRQLQELHRLVHEDVTVAPLWQTYDHFAYRRTIQGIGPRPVTLYQHVDQWRLAPQSMGNSQ